MAVAAALVGSFILILPEIARRLLVNRLEGALTVPVSIEDVDINLFTGDAAVKTLVIGPHARPIGRVPLIKLRFSRGALVRGAVDLSAASFHEPVLVVERTAEGEYNLAHAIAIDKGQGGEVQFALRRLEIHDARIDFIDRTRAPDYQISFTSIDLAAGPVSTLPGARLNPTNFTAGLSVAGGTLRLTGSSEPLAERLNLDLRVEADNLELDRFGVYLPYGSRLNLRDTIIDGRARYVLRHRGAEVARHAIDGTLQANGFSLAMAEDRQIMRLAGLEARNIHVDFLKRSAQIGALLFTEPYVRIERDAAGFNFAQFLPEGENRARDSAEPTDGAIPWTVVQAEIDRGSVEFIDRTVDPTVDLVLGNLTATGKNMTLWPDFSAGEIVVEAQSEKGFLRASGAVNDQPLKGEFAVEGKELPFTPLRGYLNALFSTARSQGDLLDGDLRLTFAPADGGAIATSISGRLEGRNMALQFPGEENPFLTTPQLAVDVGTLRFGVDPLVEIEQINFRGAQLDFLRDPNGNINLRRLWSDGGGQGQRAAEPERGNEATTTIIRAVTVEEGVINVADRSVSPNYTTRISQVTGKITELLPARNRAEISFEGVLGDAAKIQLSGWATPFTDKPYVHLEGAVRSYDLPPLNPYATEYVSQRVRQGEITTEITYTMDGNDMRAKAEVVLRDVRLGEKTGNEFEERVGIPLELALALLQDIQGVVRLQLEMARGTGPELDINFARVIWNAVRRAVVGAITAPFRLIGRIFTRGDKIELGIDPVRFQPGSREFEEQGVKQLANLAEVLKGKPRLEVRLQGQASRDEAATIRQQIFWQKIDATGARDYQDALVQVHRDMTGTRLEPPLQQSVEESLEKSILARIEIGDGDLRQLARARAETVQRELAERGIDPERLLLSAGEIAGEGDPLVAFSLVS